TTISEQLPQEYLIGELVFAPQLWPGDLELHRMSGARAARSENRATCIPAYVIDEMPTLQHIAEAFIRDVADRIVQSGAHVVGLSTTFFRIPSLALAGGLKRRATAPTVIFGGANCDGEMGIATIRNFEYVDFVVQGEAEHAASEVIDFLAERKDDLGSKKDLGS